MKGGAALTAAIAIALASLTACDGQRESSAPVPVAAPPNTAAPAAASAAAQTTAPAPAGAPSGATSEPASEPVANPVIEFSVPRTVAIGKGGEVSLTISEVAIEPRNSESMRLILLVQMLNKQRLAADFADQNFRLLTRNSEIAANGGLGETVGAGAESALERVQFVVPANAFPRALKIEFGGEATELPLTFKR